MQPLSLPNRDALSSSTGLLVSSAAKDLGLLQKRSFGSQCSTPENEFFYQEDIVHLFDLSRFDPALC
jgi:hypothetical protein